MVLHRPPAPGEVDRQADRCMDRQTHGWVDGWMDVSDVSAAAMVCSARAQGGENEKCKKLFALNLLLGSGFLLLFVHATRHAVYHAQSRNASRKVICRRNLGAQPRYPLQQLHGPQRVAAALQTPPWPAVA